MTRNLILTLALILILGQAAVAMPCEDCQCESCDQSSMCMPDDVASTTVPSTPMVPALDEQTSEYDGIEEILVEPGTNDETSESLPFDCPPYLETHSLLI